MYFLPTPFIPIEHMEPSDRPRRVVKLPPWLQSLYTQWNERNERLPLSQALSFADYIANKDDLVKLKAENNRLKEELVEFKKISCQKHDEDMANMRLYQAGVTIELKAQLAALRSELLVQVIGRGVKPVQVFKEPRSQAAFDAVRLLLYTFNKRNYKRKEKSKWGKNKEYDIIHNRESLEAWFDTKYAKDVKLNREVIEEFDVCVVRGELRTISKKFKGGVGIEAFWVPDEKYDEAGLKESSSYESTEALVNDPRRGYVLDGVKWVTATLSKKRPVA